MFRLNPKSIRWVLFIYDFFLFTITVLVFLVYYRGGGILDADGILIHAVIAFICIFAPRFLYGIYNQIWRYGGVQSYMLLITVDIAGCLIYELIDHVLPIPMISTSRIITVVTLNTLGALTMRMVYRYAFKCGTNNTGRGRFLNYLLRVFAGEDLMKYRENMENRKKLAIVGAGRSGVQLAESLRNTNQGDYLPVCFIDTNEKIIGREIQGLSVLSGKDITTEQLKEYDIQEVVLAVPAMESENRRKLFEKYQKMGYQVKVYDYPMLQTAGAERKLRSFEPEEVLFRKPIEVADEKAKNYYRGKVILITGGGGSIGSELARQIAKMEPGKLILADIYENGVYDLQQELRIRYGAAIDVQIEIISITNKAGMARIFEAWHPQIVIHAAAHKHVPLMENNCVEAVRNNVFGTENLAELCDEYHVERFLMLSTDKAVNPTNIMGATKRMCEFIVQAHSTLGRVRYSATRFGNVLGSAGSVIPLFKRQIAAGGPVTLTDRRIIRYFMTIPEASQLVLQSGAMAKNGELFVLDMGQPVKILELAENMIRLSGLKPYEDIDIIETGLRPGEKLYEELLVHTEELDRTDNQLIFIERDKPITMDQLQEKLQLLKKACDTDDEETVRRTLHQAVPTYRTPEEVNAESIRQTETSDQGGKAR